MMKVRIKKTGEIINIADYARVVLDKCDSYGNPIEVRFDEIELIQDNPSNIDWEQRRYEIAKAAMQGIISNESIEIILNDENYEYYSFSKDIGKAAVTYADALITELKKGNKK